MRKLIICIALFFCFVSYMSGQDIVRRIIDSTKKELNTAKGNKRIDCLNLLAEAYYDIWDEDDKQLDTACMYTEEAYKLAKNSGYKKGLGYSLLWKAQCYGGKVDNNLTNNNTEANYAETYNYANKAIQIGDEIKDYKLVGDVYDMLKWLERWKGDSAKFKYNVEKAIYYYEKPVTTKITGHLNISVCDQCQGNEGQLAWLYQLLATIIASKETIEAAKNQISKAIHYYEMTGEKNSVGEIYSQMGQYYFQKHDYKNSIESWLKSASYYQQAKNKEKEIGVVIESSKIYELIGDFENGVANCKRSIQLAEELVRNNSTHNATNGHSAWGQAFFWTSRLYKLGGDFETALLLIRRGRYYYPNPIDSVSNAFWSSEIGDVHRLMGNYDSALFYLKQFETLTLDRNNFGVISLGYLYLDLKKYDKALELITPYSQYLKSINRIMPPIANCSIIAANAAWGQKKYTDALQYARTGLAYLKVMDGRVLMIKNYKVLSDIFYSLNNKDSAYHYLKLYTNLKDSLLNRQFYWKLNSYKKETEEERKTSQINLLNKDNQLKEQKLKQQAFVKNGLIIGMFLLFLLGVFIFRNLSLKQKNDKLRLQKSLEMQQLESEKKHAELKQQALELEMQALRAQMNPHFIFNCLNSINRFIFKNETREASDYLTRFSRLIRMVLLHSQKKLVPLEDELEMLKLYLDMERLRFKNAFDYHLTTTNAIENSSVFIPPLLLQPFCENAIWHGLMHKEGPGHLNIELNEDNGILNCIITDDGVGREKAEEFKSKSAEKEKSMGLKITKERLSLLNQGSTGGTFYKIEDVRNEQGEIAGTRVQLKIKYKESVEEYV